MKNVIKKNNSNFLMYGILFLFILLILEFYVMHFIELYIEKGEFNTLMIESSMDRMTKKPFELSFENKSFKESLIKVQPILLLLYFTVVLLIWSTLGMKKSEFDGIEHGSASWNRSLSYFKKDKTGFIVGEELFMPMKPTRNYNYNLHQFVIGGSQSGKTFRKIKPDIMQLNSNFIITDTKGDIFDETVAFLLENFYTVKVLNLVELDESNCFNPFKYIRDEKDVLILADTFIKNTEGAVTRNETFWIKAETALLQALIFLVLTKMDKKNRHFGSVMDILLDNNALELLDKHMSKLKPTNPAVKCYNAFKLSAGETASGILVGLAVRFNIFSSEELKNLITKDDMNFDLLLSDTQDVVYFVIVPDQHRTFDVISSMFFSQLFQFLMYKADLRSDRKLPKHCRFLMDEFANLGFIPNFDSYLATIRSRNLSATIIIQELQQLKKLYKDNWEVVIGNCDTMIFMGSQSNSTRKYISEMLGKTTIHNINKNVNSGRGGGEQRNNISRDLLTQGELREIPTTHQIVIINGIKPIYIHKYKMEKKELYNEFRSTKIKNADKLSTIILKQVKELFQKIFEKMPKKQGELKNEIKKNKL